MTIHVQSSALILPAIVIGYRSWLHRSPEQLADAEYKYWSIDKSFPPWLFQMEHQAAGSSCIQTPVFGCFLSLETNRTMASKHPSELISLLQLEQPVNMQDAAKRLFSREAEQGYERLTLDFLQDLLGEYFRLPQITSGWEAFLAFENTNPLKYFSGWTMSSLRLKENAKTSANWGESAYGRTMPNSNIFADFDDLDLSADWEFNETILSELWTFRDYFSGPDARAEPEIFLLWENSD
jgi:hypothetical protein